MRIIVIALSFAAVVASASAVFAQGRCPSGQSYDSNAKRCVSDKRGS